MSFARSIWRLLVGVKDALVLLFMLLFFAALFMILTARPSPADVREGALVLDLDGIVVEERTPVDPLRALVSGSVPTREHEVRDLVRAIDAAATDDRIDAVVLDMDRFLGGGQVHLAAIGDALDKVRAADKPVLAYATAYIDDSVFLAAHASEVWMDPLGGVAVTGPGGANLYFGDALDRFGINARIYRVGTYKSAVEPYERSGMSEPARENYEALFGSLWREWQADVERARPQAQIARITERPAEWITRFEGDFASAARDAGLVDRLGSRAEFDARIVELVGEDEWSDELNAYPAMVYADFLTDVLPGDDGSAIGVVTIAGIIVDGEAGPGTAGGARIAALLDEALDDGLAGLVVRVDSPGGSVLASEEIRRAILRHKAADIPIAVSMANVAASGGYWVSTPADRIFAQPDTITGSIGIFAVLPTFEGLASDLGVATDGVQTTPLSGQPDFIGGFNPEVETILQASIEDGYRDFLRRVSRSRGLTLDQADAAGQGRVWDGGAARQLGLVDAYGGLDDAVAWVAGEAGLSDTPYHLKYLGDDTIGYESLLARWFMEEESAGGDLFAVLSRRGITRAEGSIAQARQVMSARGAQAYCLECPLLPARGAEDGGWLAMLSLVLGD